MDLVRNEYIPYTPGNPRRSERSRSRAIALPPESAPRSLNEHSMRSHPYAVPQMQQHSRPRSAQAPSYATYNPSGNVRSALNRSAGCVEEPDNRRRALQPSYDPHPNAVGHPLPSRGRSYAAQSMRAIPMHPVVSPATPSNRSRSRTEQPQPVRAMRSRSITQLRGPSINSVAPRHMSVYQRERAQEDEQRIGIVQTLRNGHPIHMGVTRVPTQNEILPLLEIFWDIRKMEISMCQGFKGLIEQKAPESPHRRRLLKVLDVTIETLAFEVHPGSFPKFPLMPVISNSNTEFVDISCWFAFYGQKIYDVYDRISDLVYYSTEIYATQRRRKPARAMMNFITRSKVFIDQYLQLLESVRLKGDSLRNYQRFNVTSEEWSKHTSSDEGSDYD